MSDPDGVSGMFRTVRRRAAVTLEVWGPLVMGALLLIAPVASASRVSPGWLGWTILAGVPVTVVAAVRSAGRRHRTFDPARAVPGCAPSRNPDASGTSVRGHGPEAAAGLQASITIVAGAVFPSPAWIPLFILLAITEGAVVRLRWTPAVVCVTALAGGAMVLLRGGTWDEALWGCALMTFLAGIATYSFRRMAEIIRELAGTREELARTAVSAERLRFARDLHDLLGHTLSLIVVKAEAVRRLVPRDPEAAAGHAADIESIGRQALLEVREAVTGYREAGLALELDRARSTLEAAGIECVVEESGPALSPETDTLLGWVVREGITNVVRHSGARRCRIALRRDADPVRVEIIDDGTGGDRVRTPASSGLRGLGERLAASGGRLETSARPGGFRLAAEVPAGDRP